MSTDHEAPAPTLEEKLRRAPTTSGPARAVLAQLNRSRWLARPDGRPDADLQADTRRPPEEVHVWTMGGVEVWRMVGNPDGASTTYELSQSDTNAGGAPSER